MPRKKGRGRGRAHGEAAEHEPVRRPGVPPVAAVLAQAQAVAQEGAQAQAVAQEGAQAQAVAQEGAQAQAVAQEGAQAQEAAKPLTEVAGRGRARHRGVAHGEPRLGADVTPVTSQMASMSVGGEKAGSLRMDDLPRRPGVGQNGRAIKLLANHFPVSIPDGVIHHYDVAITPEKCPKRLNRQLFRQMIEENPKLFRNMTPVFDGNKNMYCKQSLDIDYEKVEFEIKLKEPGRKEGRPFKIEVKWAAKVNLLELKQALKETAKGMMPYEAIQALDVVMRHLPSMRYTQVGRSFFSQPTGRPLDLGGGRELWFGYHQSMRPAAWKMMVNVNVTATSFYTAQPVTRLLAEIIGVRDISQQRKPLTDAQRMKFNREIRGVSIEVTHSNVKRRYRVCEVTRRPAQSLTFPLDDGTGKTTECTVEKYFMRQYKKKLQFPYLPCLHVGKSTGHTFQPVEVCNIVAGQRCNKKLSDKQTATMIKAMPKSAPERYGQIVDLVNKADYQNDAALKDFDIKVNPKMSAVTGRILKPPAIEYAGNLSVEPRQGAWDMRGKQFVKGVEIAKWAYLCFDTQMQPTHLQAFDEKLRSISRNMDMRFTANACIQSNISNVIELDDMFKRLKALKPQLIIAVLPPGKSSFYAKIKKNGDVLFGLTTQCVLSKNVMACSPQTISNLCLKINAKLLGVNWVLARAVRPRWMYAPVIFLGADVTHPMPGETSQPSVAAVVGSLDPTLTRYEAQVSVQKHRQEVITDLTTMVKKLLVSFYLLNNKRKPERIIFYRDGVSEGQFREVQSKEIRKVRDTCTMLEKGYEPGITFVVVQKRHHTRLFCENQQDQVGKSCNIPAGSVVDSVITHPSEFDFFLCSHNGILGTSRPTHYHVLWDDNNFTADELQMLTFQLCHTYARCTRSVSLPAPAYYAHLVAFRARYHMDLEEGSSGESQSGSVVEWSQADLTRAVTVHDDMIKNMYFI